MGSIRRRADGRWEGRYTAPDGKQRSVYGHSEKEVTAKLRGKLHEMDSGAWREPSRMTVSDWLDIWLSDYLGHATPQTVKSYRAIVEKHIRPALGAPRMVKLAPLHIRRFAAELERKGLSASTVRYCVAILGISIHAAIEAGIIKDNPCEGIRLKRAEKPELHIIDRDLIPAFFAACDGTRYPNELKIMLLTGLRMGEVCGLKWSDIDFDKKTLDVRRQIVSQTHEFVPPKFGETRTIYLPKEALDVLRAQKKTLAQLRLSSKTWDESNNDMVFLRTEGKRQSAPAIGVACKSAGQKIGVPGLHPHDLRHSYAVVALRSGADVKTVQHNLGHKSAAMTLDVYAAYTDAGGEAGALKLSEYLKI